MSHEFLQPAPHSGRQKQRYVTEALFALARQLSHGVKLPTTRELSRALRVNASTLGRSLEILEGRRVVRCLQGSGIYVDDGVNQKRIALVFGFNIFSPGASTFGMSALQYGALRARRFDERFSFYLDLDIPDGGGVMDGRNVPVHQDLVDAFRDKKIDGVILLSRSSREQEAWLRDQGVPVISCLTMESADEPENSDTIYLDYSELINLGVDALRSAGCQTVGMIGSMPSQAREFRRVLRSKGLIENENWIVCPSSTPVSFNQHPVFGAEAAEQLLAQCAGNEKDGGHHGLPDGLLIADDVMASGVLPMLACRGIGIGRDLKVCSHANKGSNVLIGWNIQRVAFDVEDLVLKLFQALEASMCAKPFDNSCSVKPVLENSTHYPLTQTLLPTNH